jgi:hypothetical protein
MFDRRMVAIIAEILLRFRMDSSLTYPEVVGSTGVLLLLVAFFLNLSGRMKHTGATYQFMNAVGASLSCYASYLIGFFPFVILEGTWSVVALVALVYHYLKRRVGTA